MNREDGRYVINDPAILGERIGMPPRDLDTLFENVATNRITDGQRQPPLEFAKAHGKYSFSQLSREEQLMYYLDQDDVPAAEDLIQDPSLSRQEELQMRVGITRKKVSLLHDINPHRYANEITEFNRTTECMLSELDEIQTRASREVVLFEKQLGD